MDLSQHLGELSKIAPRSFDRQLIEFLIAATQSGQRPLVITQHDDSGTRREVEELRALVTELSASLAQSNAQLLKICRALDDRISSYAVKVEKAA
jgi:hypothetical protein